VAKKNAGRVEHAIRFILCIISITVCYGNSASGSVSEFESVLIRLGSADDFSSSAKGFLPDAGNWGRAGKDGEVAYRQLKPGTKTNVLFAAFDVDTKGFCKHDMILEIFYRDDIKQWTDKNNRVQGRVLIQSRIDFAKGNEYIELGHLTAVQDRQWKVARIFLERTARQVIRVIDGSFQFKIVTPGSPADAIPISYIKLSSVSHGQLVSLREEDRLKRGLKRVEYKPPADKKTCFGQTKTDFVVYPVNYLRLVFPNSAVDSNKLNKPLRCFEVPGQDEPVSFVIHAYKDLQKVRVVVNDLHGPGGKIPSANVDVRNVRYNDQRWTWGQAVSYGTCPDYLGFPDPVADIKANANCQFWLTIKVPASTAPGLYEGEAGIYSNGEQVQILPLSVEVLPIKLLPNRVKHFIFHDPRTRDFHQDFIKVLQDMKNHGVVPVLYPVGHIIETKQGLDVELDVFEIQLQEFRSIYPDTKELFVVIYNCYQVWHRLGGGKPVFTERSVIFETTYRRVLKKYAEMGKRYGFELYFSFHDEPFKVLQKRRASYLCSHIAQSKGLKTWSTHQLACDVQLPLTSRELTANLNYLRPLKEVLDVFVEAVIRIDDNSIETLKKSQCDLSYYTTYLATSIRPVYNRFLHGIYPFVIGAEFITSYAYRDSIVDPYDDLDVKATMSFTGGAGDYLLTYPTWQGDILPILSYEALREGVEDSCLISTLQTLVCQALQYDDVVIKNSAKEAENYLNDIINRISKNFKQRYYTKRRASIIDPVEQTILKDLNNGRDQGYEIFDSIRSGICDRIILIQNALSKSADGTAVLPEDL